MSAFNRQMVVVVNPGRLIVHLEENAFLVHVSKNHKQAAREVADDEEEEQEEPQSDGAGVNLEDVAEVAALSQVAHLVVHFEEACNANHLDQAKQDNLVHVQGGLERDEHVVKRDQREEVKPELVAQIPFGDQRAVFDELALFFVVRSVEHDDHVEEKEDFADESDDGPLLRVDDVWLEGYVVRDLDAGEDQQYCEKRVPSCQVGALWIHQPSSPRLFNLL